MNQIISKLVDDNCSHDSKVNISGKIVCQDCGLELEEEYVNDNFMGASPHTNKMGLNRRYVGEFVPTRYISKVGSNIGISKGSIKNNKDIDINKFKRLNRRNTHFQAKSVFKNYISFTILDNIGKFLSIPEYILEDSALRFRKITNSETLVINRVSCLCFCLWDSIRHYKYHICLKEVISAFNKMGHRVGARLLIRDGTTYREILSINGIKKTVPKAIRDYIGRHIGALQSNKDYIKDRLRAKKFDIDPMLYISKIEKVCYKILGKLQPLLLMKGTNPFDMSASLVYFASLYISKNNNKKGILTQKKLEEFTTVPAYCIRAGYIENLKQFL